MKTILLSILLLTISSHSADVKCEQFKTYQDAKKYYQAHKHGYQALDRNSNGNPCEHLKKNTSKKTKRVSARIKIYKYGYPDGAGEKFSSMKSCERKRAELTKSHIGSDYSYKCEAM
jgi:hypothetical protein